MATLNQHISNLRGLIIKYSRTQENYTDQTLYELLNGARTEVIKNIAKKFNHISASNYQTFTIALEESDPPNWECVPTYLKGKCKVRKSKYKVPNAVKGRNKSLFSFKTLGGQSIDIYSETEQEIFKNDKVRSKHIMASIINNYLYIWNRPDLQFVKVTGVWEDPTKWSEIPDCTGELDVCYNILTDDYPLDTDDQNMVYKMSIEMLGIPLKLQYDQTNDSNEFIKA